MADTQEHVVGNYSGEPKAHTLLAQQFALFFDSAPELCDPEMQRWMFWMWLASWL